MVAPACNATRTGSSSRATSRCTTRSRRWGSPRSARSNKARSPKVVRLGSASTSRAQCTTIVAIGGPGVRDLDVALLDADDKPVAHDTTKEPQATLRACPAARRSLHAAREDERPERATSWRRRGRAARARRAPSDRLRRRTRSRGLGAGTCESPLHAHVRQHHGQHASRRGGEHRQLRELRVEGARLQARGRASAARHHRGRPAVRLGPLRSQRRVQRRPRAEVACNDDATSGAGKRGPSSRGSRLDEVLEPATYYVFVDGYGSESGGFRMNVQIADVPTLAEACRQIPVRSAPRRSPARSPTPSITRTRRAAPTPKAPTRSIASTRRTRARVRITEHSADFSPVGPPPEAHAPTSTARSRAPTRRVKADEATWAGVLDPGSYVLFADSADKDARGRYTLETELAPEAGSGVRGDACGDATTLLLEREERRRRHVHRADDVAGKCGGQGAPDVVYRFELTRRSRVTAQLPTQEGNHVFVAHAELRRSREPRSRAGRCSTRCSRPACISSPSTARPPARSGASRSASSRAT